LNSSLHVQSIAAEDMNASFKF